MSRRLSSLVQDLDEAARGVRTSDNYLADDSGCGELP
jgi:hypothetical protein